MTQTTEQMEQRLGMLLAGWGVASLMAGGALWRSGHRTRRSAFGRQTAAWGAIDLGIAAVGLARSRRRSAPATAADRKRLHRVLVVNSLLDVGYVAGGAALLTRADAVAPRLPGRRQYSAEELRGDGAAVIIQGAFLLVLDTVFVARTRG